MGGDADDESRQTISAAQLLSMGSCSAVALPLLILAKGRPEAQSGFLDLGLWLAYGYK